MTVLAPSLQAYFTDRLIGQRSASPNTIAAYQLTLRLLLVFTSTTLAKPPSDLDIAELDAPLIAAFLDHLEQDRANSVSTRNNRLATIHSLFAYLALHHPEHAASIRRVLAIPPKRTEQNLLTHLTDTEVDGLLATIDQSTWTGRRDHAMFALTIQTGLRISELAELTRQDITPGVGANVHTVGKGRRNGAPRSSPPPPASLRPGSNEHQAIRPTHCSRPEPADRSAATPSNTVWPTTSRQPHESVRPSKPSE
jgi:integrase/recombinase XerD